MLVVGLTGGIAAGKTLVADALRERGVPVMDADRSARAVVEAGSSGLEQVVAAFGEDVLDGYYALDRKKLGELVFADPQARKTLESILHPLIAADLATRLAKLRREGTQLAVVDAALMIETGSYTNYAALVVVHADDDTRIQRLMVRDGLTRAEARQRLESQMPQQRKMELADYLIDNNGRIDDTLEQVNALLVELRELALLQ
jgi:dephospho-CoA kinase